MSKVELLRIEERQYETTKTYNNPTCQTSGCQEQVAFRSMQGLCTSCYIKARHETNQDRRAGKGESGDGADSKRSASVS